MLKQFMYYFNRISKMTKDKFIYKIVLINICMVIIAIFTPALIAKIITKMINSEFTGVISTVIVLAILQICSLLLNILNSKVFHKFKRDINTVLRRKIATSILNMDIRNINSHKKGEFIQKINKDPFMLGFCINTINKYVFTLITNIGIIVYIMYLNIILGSIYAISFVLILIIRKKGLDRKNNYRKQYYKEEEKSSTLLGEILNGIREIKQLDLSNEFDKKTEKILTNSENLQYNADLKLDICVKLSNIIQWIANGAIILSSAFLIKKQLMETDVFITAFMYRINIYSFADNFTDLIDNIMEFNLISNRIFEIIDLYNNPKDKETIQNKCIGTIKFRNVNFSYDKINVLKNCSFTVNPNEFVAITGESGAGKTTILNLIANIYDVSSGKIFIDDVNIKDLSNACIRQNISMISQNTYLFDMSIKENLKLVKPDATDVEIEEICKKVGLEKFIQSLPEKYNTLIGEGRTLLKWWSKAENCHS